MDVLADHLGDIGMEDGWDDPQVTPDGSIKCGCLAEFPDITAWRAHLAQAIIDNIDASKEAYEALNRVDVEATREAGEMNDEPWGRTGGSATTVSWPPRRSSWTRRKTATGMALT